MLVSGRVQLMFLMVKEMMMKLMVFFAKGKCEQLLFVENPGVCFFC